MTTATNVVELAALKTDQLIDEFQQVWNRVKDQIENDDLIEVEPLVTAMVSRLTGKVESEYIRQGWTSSPQKQQDQPQHSR